MNIVFLVVESRNLFGAVWLCHPNKKFFYKILFYILVCFFGGKEESLLRQHTFSSSGRFWARSVCFPIIPCHGRTSSSGTRFQYVCMF